MILGTAGHVDHGKTALVRALTGVDTDRLPDEKRRGITIDLGFAPLRLDGLPPVGVVDVPGHEAFVRNMLAGATGIDLALLVIAADEGVMPQTREHLLILQLLGVSGGVVALTKADLVDDEWLALVREEVAGLKAGTPLESAPVIATSSVTGRGMDELRQAVAAAVRARPARDAADLFRMPVDRAFTVRGTGTVVTGTVWSGTLARDATVQIRPGTGMARVRGLQSHGAALATATPGMRVAVALAGADLAEVGRGAVLVTDPAWKESVRLHAEVALSESAEVTLGPRSAVRFHLGTTEVGARIIAAGGALAPGARSLARVVFDRPVVARAGDRFVLRAFSPVRTIGGGIVVDPAPLRRRQRLTGLAPSLTERFEALVRDSGLAGVPDADVPLRLGVSPATLARLLQEAQPAVVVLGSRLVAGDVLEAAVDTAARLVDDFHSAHPLERGMPVQELRARIGGTGEITGEVLRRAAGAGRLQLAGALAWRAGWVPKLAPDQEDVGRRLLEVLREAGREPPSVGELGEQVSSHASSILKFLERNGKAVQVAPDRFYDPGALSSMIETLRHGMDDGRSHTPQELRDLLGISRKFLIPFLEYCDRTGVTERRADGRVLSEALRAGDRPGLA
ncbi:MAG TPA: selenocysteine-specific translation elongation factor [Gemmatimonadaceae bacterium]|nr:selenocysteine-specific translation elongation factor [Gemmatimonadaceae bacterium]